jgi:molybdopterin converting factor subunit 1
VRVTVLLFARLREAAGRGEWHCEVPAGATVADVWRAAVVAHPDLAAFTSIVSAAKNDDFSAMAAPVDDGDQVAFLPPVSGGASRG